MKIPKIKKTVKSFLLGEEGKISRQSILKTGVFLAVASAALVANSEDVAAGHDSGKVHANIDCPRSSPHGNCSKISHYSHSNSWNGGGSHGSKSCSVNIPAKHGNNLKLGYSQLTATGTHTHNDYPRCVQNDHGNYHYSN